MVYLNLTLLQSSDPSFAFATSSFCEGDANPTPTITGTTGGTFSASSGVVVNATTGEVDIAATGLGLIR